MTGADVDHGHGAAVPLPSTGVGRFGTCASCARSTYVYDDSDPTWLAVPPSSPLCNACRVRPTETKL